VLAGGDRRKLPGGRESRLTPMTRGTPSRASPSAAAP
jgi:hypothetical protein